MGYSCALPVGRVVLAVEPERIIALLGCGLLRGLRRLARLRLLLRLRILPLPLPLPLPFLFLLFLFLARVLVLLQRLVLLDVELHPPVLLPPDFIVVRRDRPIHADPR